MSDYLKRLGFTDDDRYDGMIVSAAHGSKSTTLEVDFALFNSENENLEENKFIIPLLSSRSQLCLTISIQALCRKQHKPFHSIT